MSLIDRQDLQPPGMGRRLVDFKAGVDYLDPKHYLLAGVPDQISRLEFLKACERLEIPPERWPDFGTVMLPGGMAQPPGTPQIPPQTMGVAVPRLSFELPPFDLCADDHRSWKRKADAAWKQFREKQFGRYLRKCTKTQRFAVKIRLLVPRKKTRFPGSKRNPIPLEKRYEFAVRRYCLQETWATLQTMEKGQYSFDQIRKSVTKLLAGVGLKSGRKRLIGTTNTN